MFYSQFILAKKGPLGTIWIAAHLERKLRKNQVADTDIGVSVDSIIFPEMPIALRLSSHLLLGVVRIYSRKVGYLFDDCSEALLKVKQAFRSTAVDLPPEESKAPYHSITLPETFELDDFELPDNDIFQGNYVDHHVSSREQITLQDSMEGVVYSTSKFGLDERFGDADTSGLDLDEELFLDKVAAAGDASVSADPQTSVEPMTPIKQEHHEGMAANSESMYDGVDGDADFMDHAPCTPGLAEEPNLSNVQETSACEDQLGGEDRHLPEYAVKGNLENLSCEDNMNDGSKLPEIQALTGGSDADTVHFMAPEENGYHLGNRSDKQLEPDGELPPGVVANESFNPALASAPSSAAVHQVHAKSSALEGEEEIVAASDGQTYERNLQCGLSGMDEDVSIPNDFHALPQLPNGIRSTNVDNDVSALSNICQPAPEDISPGNQRSPEAVTNGAAIPGSLEASESQDMTCLETPKTDESLKAGIVDDGAAGAQGHVLNRCSAAQPDAAMSESERGVNHEPPSDFSGFHPLETPREEASHASGDDIRKDSDKSNDQVNNVVLENYQAENMSSSAASVLPAPEKILSVPGGLVDLPRSIFPEATPDIMGTNEADTGSKFISGKKRSYTESTLTEQSLNSAESSRMVRSKKTAGFIPDDDDLLSSILVGRRSSALKLRPTPPPSEITSSKRPRSTTRMSASKRKVLMDDIMVLHGDMIRQQLINVEDIRRTRKKAPCTHAEISVIQKQLLEDEIFREAILTGVSVELASLYKKTFDLSAVKVSSSDVNLSHSAMGVDPQPTSEHAEIHISNLEEERGMMFNEPDVERESGKKGSDDQYAARDDSILEAVEATVPAENRDADNDEKRLNSDTSPLRSDSVTDVAAANAFHREPSDNAAEKEPQGTCLSGSEAAEATDIPSAAEVLLSCPNNGGLGGDGDVVAGMPRTDSLNDSRREDASSLAEVSCGSPNRAFTSQVDKALEHLTNENFVDGSGLPESNFFTSEAEAGTETRVGDAVRVEAALDSATVEAITNVENVTAECDNQSIASKGLGTEQPYTDATYKGVDTEQPNADATYEGMNTEQPNTYSTYDEINMHMDHSLGDREYPCQQEDFSYNMMGADLSDANLGDLNDLDYSAAENDTGFLNFDDDDEEAEAADDYVPDADVTRITENSGWSSRTRAVSKYLQTLFIKESEHGRKSLSIDTLLVGKTKKEASRMFFESLVLKTRDYIHVEQVIPFDDVTIMPRMKLMKSDF